MRAWQETGDYIKDKSFIYYDDLKTSDTIPKDSYFSDFISISDFEI